MGKVKTNDRLNDSLQDQPVAEKRQTDLTVPPSEVHIFSPAANAILPSNFVAMGSVQPSGTAVSGYLYSLMGSMRSATVSATVTQATWIMVFNLPSDFPTGLAKLKVFIDDAATEPASDILLVTLGTMVPPPPPHP